MDNTVLGLSVNFITANLNSTKSKPLIIGIQGPQGSGKSTLAHALKTELQEYKTVTLSLDDFYLPRNELMKRYDESDNKWIYEKRGLPGTHDLLECCEVLEKLKLNEVTRVPRYNKTLFNGEGDREGYEICTPPYDIVIFEGWMNNYKPRDCIMNNAIISEINENLKQYQPLFSVIDCSIYLLTDDLQNVYDWRWEQEKVLSKKEVYDFVDRFMICYKEYYEDEPFSAVSSILITLNSKREVTKVREC